MGGNPGRRNKGFLWTRCFEIWECAQTDFIFVENAILWKKEKKKKIILLIYQINSASTILVTIPKQGINSAFINIYCLKLVSPSLVR